MSDQSIYIISGSNRPTSNTLKIAQLLRRHYEQISTPATVFSLADLPLEIYSPDAYENKPAAFLDIQDAIERSAGLHIVVPEYNGSFPGVLKHFIDMLKFPESLDRKPIAFVGVATGQWGGLRAVEQLQLVVGYRNAHVYPERIFVPNVQTRLDSAGELIDPDLEKRFVRQTKAFAEFAGLVARAARP
jgi:NAD(P)H-dependent FMN reductase